MNCQHFIHLASLRVADSTCNEYDRALEQFTEWAAEDFHDGEHVENEDVLKQFAHYIYDERDGGGLKLLEKVKAGMEFYFPP